MWTGINLLNSHNKPLQQEEAETERLSNLPKVTQWPSSGVEPGVEIQTLELV